MAGGRKKRFDTNIDLGGNDINNLGAIPSLNNIIPSDASEQNKLVTAKSIAPFTAAELPPDMQDYAGMDLRQLCMKLLMSQSTYAAGTYGSSTY
jgi:hypothetical protein